MSRPHHRPRALADRRRGPSPTTGATLQRLAAPLLVRIASEGLPQPDLVVTGQVSRLVGVTGRTSHRQRMSEPETLTLAGPGRRIATCDGR